MIIELGKDIVSEFAAATSREWLETNGIGGYASGTVSGAHTRRYHGLLVAATEPPLGRAVLLSKLEETVVIDGRRFELSANKYPETVYPSGHKHLKRFRLDPFPIWTYEIDGHEIEKKIFMPHGSNATIVQWTLLTNRLEVNAVLEVRPLIAFRDHHRLRHEFETFDTTIETENSCVSMRPDAKLPKLFLQGDFTSAKPTGEWYRNFEYAVEKERGFDFHEDLYQPCLIIFDLTRSASLIASTEQFEKISAAELETAEVKRRAALIAGMAAQDALSKQLLLAADQFIVDRGDGKTVIAGYHWFSDWGRDTMIALPGLTLATNRPEIAKSILSEFAEHISEGMIPNRFPDVSETPEYNTVDATLWFFEAIRDYLETTGDEEFIRNALYEKLVEIIERHVRGTRHNIHVDTDGLLYAGEPGVQLTWMDAKIGDWVVTPRTGKAVEIQALWHNALRTMSDLAERFGDRDRAANFAQMADVAKASFNGQFWNEEEGCLFDVVDGDEKDASIRPNQIFAVSLHYSMLDLEKSRMVVEKVETRLLTPFGLRSLSPDDLRYVPVYIGSPRDRDAAYHQGTVWGWLIGPFVEAFRKTHQDVPDARAKVEEITSAFKRHLSEAMLGQISEIFDADPPHHPRGCAAQAWSVGELLRVLSRMKN